MATHSVLFLCTGNSARSQMAEGLVNHFVGQRWSASSAGTRPTGHVHPLALRAMDELGIDLSAHSSKGVEDFEGRSFDVVVTVCDGAAKDCPAWLGTGKGVHIGFDDPAAATGSESDRLAAFRTVRDGLRDRVLPLLAELDGSQDRIIEEGN